MTQAPVSADVHQAFDVHLHALAEVAFDLALVINDGANTTELVFAQIPDARINADLRFSQDRGRTRPSNAENVCQSDLRPLIRRKIDTSDTSHCLLLHFGFQILDFRLKTNHLTMSSSRFGSANPKSVIALPLTLFMFRISADHAHDALAVDDLAVIAHLFD
jgi:hypothetical protein